LYHDEKWNIFQGRIVFFGRDEFADINDKLKMPNDKLIPNDQFKNASKAHWDLRFCH
jgi:hypothetical protein